MATGKLKTKRFYQPVSAASSSSPKKTKAGSLRHYKEFIESIVIARQKCANSVEEFTFEKARVKLLSNSNDVAESSKGIVYWMSRDQRVQDNWAFLYAQRLALKCEESLHICFCLVPKFLDATLRQFEFLIGGLQEVELECKKLDVPFHLLIGEAPDVLPEFVEQHAIGGVVTDFSPLRVSRQWVNGVKERLPLHVTFCQVDAHNIVPCWEASKKLEYSARTIRGKIHHKLRKFLTEYPPVIKHPFLPVEKLEPVDWDEARRSLLVDHSIGAVDWAKPGSEAGFALLHTFCIEYLKNYALHRNDPNKKAVSNLSPWLHFGQLSAQRCILVVEDFKTKYKESVSAFIEETVVRRELADNFCYYNENYDKIEGGSEWARKTLDIHRTDQWEYIYTRQQFENAETHDDLWNASQLQMVREGKMHGFLRMYWAKKILEWAASPEEALEIAIYLNDRYELDGRDPNGYVGCMWSIVGIHDQGWAERKVFGKIRFMNYQGCKRKFDVNDFVMRHGSRHSQ